MAEHGEEHGVKEAFTYFKEISPLVFRPKTEDDADWLYITQDPVNYMLLSWDLQGERSHCSKPKVRADSPNIKTLFVKDTLKFEREISDVESLLQYLCVHCCTVGHNCATALIQLYDLWLDAANAGELTAALLLDLSAAFDLVGHAVLLKKLRLYNFCEEALKWFQDYLEDRKQIVQVESKRSEEKEIGENSVGQGTILAVLLFLISQNDFPASMEEDADSILYVDDDTDNVKDSDPEVLEQKLQIQAKKSTEWIRDNNMVCSGEKTKLLVIGTKGKRNQKLVANNKVIRVEVCDKIVEESKDEKLLGIIISNDLTWKTHLYGNKLTGDDKIVGLVSKLSQRVGILYKLSKIMTSSQFAKVCEGLFTSKLTNCLEVFGNVWGLDNMDEENRRTPAFNKEDNRRLQVIENKIMRMKTGLGRDTPTVDLVKAAGDLSVHQLTAFTTIMTVFRVLTTGKPKYLSDKMKLRRPGGDDGAAFPLRHQFTITI